MFKLQEVYQYTWPIRVKVPSDGGKHITQTFTGEFRVVEQDRADEILAAGVEGIDQALLREVWTGWGEDVGDQNGDPLPFNNENREKLLNIPFIRIALVQAYHDSINGRRQKN